MRPQGTAGALIAIAVGAILTYAVSFTVSGVSIHIVGVIIMIVGAIALGILLVRFVSGSRLRGRPRRPQNAPDPSADGVYPQDPMRGAPPIAATRIFCANKPVRADHLDQVVWEHITTLLANPALIHAEIDKRLTAARCCDPTRLSNIEQHSTWRCPRPAPRSPA